MSDEPYELPPMPPILRAPEPSVPTTEQGNHRLRALHHLALERARAAFAESCRVALKNDAAPLRDRACLAVVVLSGGDRSAQVRWCEIAALLDCTENEARAALAACVDDREAR